PILFTIIWPPTRSTLFPYTTLFRSGYTQTLPVKSAKALDPEEVHDVEAELARHIGPLAKVLVRKAQALAPTIQALRNALAPSIQDRKSTRLNSSHVEISYAVFCLKK